MVMALGYLKQLQATSTDNEEVKGMIIDIESKLKAGYDRLITY